MARPKLQETLIDFLNEFFGYVDDERRERSLDSDNVADAFADIELGDLGIAYLRWHEMYGPSDDEGETQQGEGGEE